MTKISLCLIAGNVEEYIERCLTSFAPIADEICIVRAIGNLVPDRTIDIAEKFARDTRYEIRNSRPENRESENESRISNHDSRVFRWSEYKNKPEHQSWPHLDDFAAARQQSFDMATGDYIFWCDTDDVLKSGAEFVREHANRNGYPLFMFPYDIFGRGVDFTRERMILRGAGKWKFPVHECFNFNNPGIQGVEDFRVVVQHLPSTHKTGSNERNLRILEAMPEDEINKYPGLLYHLHGELLPMPGRKKEAIDAAKKALACKELGRPERYEIFLNLGRMAAEPEVATAFFHQAYATDPCRREALGLLTCSALDYQHYHKALAYARQMLATNEPTESSWNDRKAAYQWLGIEIYTQALRMNNYHEEAEICRRRLLEEAGGPIISLIHATRGRPRQASIARKVWLDLAERPDRIEHIFVIDDDDKASLPLTRMHNIIIPGGGGCVNAWNSGVMACNGDIVIQMSDDWMPPPRWDALILERFPNLESPSVLAVSDGHRTDDLLCMVICTRPYLQIDWFMFHPRFTGVYSDNWFTREAYRRGVVINAKDLVFTHNHPLFENRESRIENREPENQEPNLESRITNLASAQFDETYARQNAPERYKEGKAVYKYLLASSAPSLQRFNGSSDWSTVPGWFNYWMFYRQIAQNLKDGDVVAEIGVWLGRSIIYLAQECQRLGKKVKIIAVDNFKGESNQIEHMETVRLAGGSIYKKFQANIERCGVADMIETFIGDSAEEAIEVEDGSLAFCFIDAAHDYESVKHDITAWLPKLRPNAILAGHDADWPEVKKAITEFFPDAKIIGPVWIHLKCDSIASRGGPRERGNGLYAAETFVHSP